MTEERFTFTALSRLRVPSCDVVSWGAVWRLRPPRCVSTGPVVVRLAEMANERERERERISGREGPIVGYSLASYSTCTSGHNGHEVSTNARSSDARGTVARGGSGHCTHYA